MSNGRATLEHYPGHERLAARTHVYYPPVDTDVFRPATAAEIDATRAHLGVPPSAPLVGTVANVNPQKGIAAFIRMAQRVRTEIPSAQFVVVGDLAASQRRYVKLMQAEVVERGLGNSFTWLGSRSDVPRLVAAFDVKVIASVPQSEGTTTTAGEAMACGIPVVATDVGAVSEVVIHDETGFIVAANDEVAMSERVTALIRQSELRRRLGTSGRERAIEHLSVDRCADVHAAVYRHALAARWTK